MSEYEIEELAFKKRNELANLNEIDLLNIIEFLQLDRKECIIQFSRAHNDYIDLRQENKQLQQKANALDELEEWLKDQYRKYNGQVIDKIITEEETFNNDYTDFDKTVLALDLLNISMECVLSKIQELKEGESSNG